MYNEDDKTDSNFLRWVSNRLQYVFLDRSGKPNSLHLVADKMDGGIVLSYHDTEFLRAIVHLLTKIYGDSVSASHVLRLQGIARKEQYEPTVTVQEDRPPLGLSPRKVCDRNRADQIIGAMTRYAEGNKLIPLSWVEELKERLNG